MHRDQARHGIRLVGRVEKHAVLVLIKCAPVIHLNKDEDDLVPHPE
jgi:hypothetical protein